MPDNYVSDTANTTILQEIYHGGTPARPGGVSDDQIILSYHNQTQSLTRPDVVNMLLARYSQQIGSTPQSPRDFLFGIQFTPAQILNSLYWPNGDQNAQGRSNWAGFHSGTWFQDTGPTFEDNARWHAPIISGTHSSGEDYWFQKVEFFEPSCTTVSKTGWNQSCSAIDYLWGWDPKGVDVQPSGGNVGAHLGFKVSTSDADVIVWFTKNECYLEAIAQQLGQRRRISVGLFGTDFWEIS